MVRKSEQQALVEASGGVPYLGDVADPVRAEEAASDCDAILHLAAPSDGDSSTEEGRQEFDRSRVRGARNLVAAARAKHVPRFLLGSGYWLYGDHPGVITEDSDSQPTEVVAHNWGAEEVARAAQQPGTLDVVIVRPTMVYGDGAWFRPMFDSIRNGTYRYVGDGSNHWSFIHRDDCGAAFLSVLDHGAGGETYIATDDEPVSIRTFSEFVASELHAIKPEGIPLARATNELGRSVATALGSNQAASNRKLRTLGCRPRFPSYRVGVPPTIREMVSH